MELRKLFKVNFTASVDVEVDNDIVEVVKILEPLVKPATDIVINAMKDYVKKEGE